VARVMTLSNSLELLEAALRPIAGNLPGIVVFRRRAVVRTDRSLAARAKRSTGGDVCTRRMAHAFEVVQRKSFPE
jgi:hypothetical protein